MEEIGLLHCVGNGNPAGAADVFDGVFDTIAQRHEGTCNRHTRTPDACTAMHGNAAPYADILSDVGYQYGKRSRFRQAKVNNRVRCERDPDSRAKRRLIRDTQPCHLIQRQ